MRSKRGGARFWRAVEPGVQRVCKTRLMRAPLAFESRSPPGFIRPALLTPAPRTSTAVRSLGPVAHGAAFLSGARRAQWPKSLAERRPRPRVTCTAPLDEKGGRSRPANHTNCRSYRLIVPPALPMRPAPSRAITFPPLLTRMPPPLFEMSPAPLSVMSRPPDPGWTLTRF